MVHKKSTFYKAAKETLIEYFKKTSLNGFGLLYYIRRRKYQSLFWFSCIISGISFATYVVIFTTSMFLRNPTYTSWASRLIDIAEIPFPALAICNTNKFSYSSMEKLAAKLSMLSQTKEQNTDYWLAKAHLFVGYYEPELVDAGAASVFQAELEHYLGDVHVPALLKSLAPTCYEQLIICRLAGVLRKCEELFQLMATPIGYCCVFNYELMSNKSRKFHNYYHKYSGVEMGLMLLLNTSSTDGFSTINTHTGYVAQIFGTHIFPDEGTGAIQELHVSAGEVITAELHTFTQLAVPEVREYNIEQRKCFFANEFLDKSIGEEYSQSMCLSRCRLRNVYALCSCIPFYITAEMANSESANNISYCTLADIDCLKRYAVTLSTFQPTEWKNKLQDGLNCELCLPRCGYYQYEFGKRTSKLSQVYNVSDVKKFLTNDSNIPAIPVDKHQDYSTINLCFRDQMVRQYRKNVLYNWYQILSNIGGVVSVCMGFSIISAIEMIYFASIRLIENIRHFHRNA